MKSHTARAALAVILLDLGLSACGADRPGSSAALSGTWTPAASLHRPREGGGAGLGSAAARLPDGRVLVAGGYSSSSGKFENRPEFFLTSAEIYDPKSNKWVETASMSHPRFGAAVVALPKAGLVLAAGGAGAVDNAVISPSAEVFDPAKGTWRLTAPMSTCRISPSATVLASGDVLVAGGIDCDQKVGASAEIYRAATREWAPAAPMREARWGHSATALADGRVLVAGGRSTPAGAGPEQMLMSAEIYDPARDTWAPAAPLHVARALHVAAVLSNGKVIVAGGHPQDPSDSHATTPTAELYDPATGAWTVTGSMKAGREEGGGAVLSDGTFLVAGGGQQRSAEIYNPVTGTWSTTGEMRAVHDDAQLTVLDSGDVLIQGGFAFTDHNGYRNTGVAELFHPPSA